MEKLYLFSQTSSGDIEIKDKTIYKTEYGWKYKRNIFKNLEEAIKVVLEDLEKDDPKISEIIKKIWPNKFHCTCCGECCRHISKLLPEFDTGNGVCCHLKNNKCDIYNSRPLICNVEKFWIIKLRNIMTKEDWYKQNYLGCEYIKNKFL